MRTNPLPIIVPCHRVVSKSGESYFTIPCLSKKPDNCHDKNLKECSSRIKNLLQQTELNRN